MRKYIAEAVENTTRHFKFGNIPVQELEPTPDDINLTAIFKALPEPLLSETKRDKNWTYEGI